ncbi:MAG: IPT/TIG domain-containing protein [Gemmatimonadota bacterium]
MTRFRKSLALLLLAFAAAFPLLGCPGNHPPSARENPAEIPSVVSITPDRGRVGEAYPIEVTIEGTGFVEEGNIVTFGGIPSEALVSTDGGTRITFWVPKEVPSTGEVPPMILDPGEYEVTVTTPSGTSEPVTFVLTRGE